MRSLTYTLDTQTGSDAMAPVTVTITELDDGTLQFQVSNVDDADNLIGDLRALFFDVADDALLGTLSASGGDITEVSQTGSVDNLGNGATSSGVPDSPYEVGIEFGTAGISGDDIQSTTFVLSSSLRGLTLDDIALQGITVRQTSVGEADGSRDGSDKLYGFSPYPVNAMDDAIVTDEDNAASGNLFTNDIDLDAGDMDSNGIADGLVITEVNGEAGLVGETIELGSGADLVVNADGSFSVDPTGDLDWLAVGESVTETFVYGVSDGNGGSDDASVTITINGVNDLPIAEDDVNSTDENTVVGGSLLDNDSDPDLSDILTVGSVNGDSGAVGSQITLASGALLTVNADGSYSYDPNGQFADLLTGESATDSFTYEASDGHGGTDTATVTIDIQGIGENGPSWEDEDHFGTFLNKKGIAQAISNVVLYLQDGEDITKVKIDGWDGTYKDLDDVDLGAFLDTYFEDSELVAVSIKAGNNHNADLGPGEGQLFLLDGDEDVDYVAGGPVPDGLTFEDLAAKADITFTFDHGLFG